MAKKQTQPAPPEVSFDVQGAGFIDGYPGHYANCRAVFNADTRELLRIESLTALPEPAPVEEEQPVEEEAVPKDEPQDSPQPISESNGG